LPEPRNLAFASGLDDWIIGGRFRAGPTLLAELATMSTLAKWLTRWQPIAIHGAMLAGRKA
jgi:hypothetical protein